MIRSKEAHTNAVILESLADIPDAEIKPPENVLFVCKLNPVTQDEDLYTIFSRFGTVTSAEIIRDYKTGDSLCYAFIEFDTKEACERAYFKMDNCLIDDRRIHVDFSQSVSKLWGQFRQSKRNAKKDGCFNCGAPDHLARDCDQDGEQKNKGPSYVLKDENTQRGGNHRRSYDLVFDEDEAEYSDKRDNENGHRRKNRRIDDRKSELPPRSDSDRNRHERAHSDEKGSRHGKYDSNRRGSKHDEYHSYSRSGDRYNDRDYSKHHNRSRSGEEEEGYRRRDKSDGERRHRDDGHEKSDRHRRDEDGYRKRSPDSRQRREDGHHVKNQHSDDRSYKERRHRDSR